MGRILVINADEPIGCLLLRFLKQDHHQVMLADHWEDSFLADGQDRFNLIVTAILKGQEDARALIEALARGCNRIPVLAFPGGMGLMRDGVSVESASMRGIRITMVRNFVSADLRQAVAEALA